MKICFIINNIFEIGGVQRVVSVLANGLIQYYEIEIVCISHKTEINTGLYNLSPNISIVIDSNLMKLNKKDKFHYKLINRINKKTDLLKYKCATNILKNGYYNKKREEKFIKYINSRDYDIVIGVEGELSILLGCISERIKAKTIGWLHNSYNAYLNTPNKYYYKQHNIFKKYIPMLDRCFVLTNEDKNSYKNILNVDCEVMYNPLSFESDKKSLCNDNNIVFVGRLVKEQKGLDLLIDAFNIVKENSSNWKLTIVGDGKDKDWLVKLIKDKRLGKYVNLVGGTNNVIQYYLKSSIFVSSSRWEGFGLVITEAMECGVPVVAFDNSGPIEIIDKNMKNGILVPKEDTQALANSILYLINDVEARINMSHEAIKRARDFKIHNVINKWNDILNDIN